MASDQAEVVFHLLADHVQCEFCGFWFKKSIIDSWGFTWFTAGDLIFCSKACNDKYIVRKVKGL